MGSKHFLCTSRFANGVRCTELDIVTVADIVSNILFNYNYINAVIAFTKVLLISFNIIYVVPWALKLKLDNNSAIFSKISAT